MLKKKTKKLINKRVEKAIVDGDYEVSAVTSNENVLLLRELIKLAKSKN
jgi:hypothetical protein|tara:strand:+ start:119 stop:265 length:147 start_codon:yes stop_codon:yes gene_type:complete